VHNLAAIESATKSVSSVTDGIFVEAASIGAGSLLEWGSSISAEHMGFPSLQSEGARIRMIGVVDEG
jgi:hypothetical protein